MNAAQKSLLAAAGLAAVALALYNFPVSGIGVPRSTSLGVLDLSSGAPQTYDFRVPGRFASFALVATESADEGHPLPSASPAELRVRVFAGGRELLSEVVARDALIPANWHEPRRTALLPSHPTVEVGAPHVLELTVSSPAPEGGRLQVFVEFIDHGA